MRRLPVIVAIIIGVIAAACSRDDTFRIDLAVDDIGLTPVTMTWVADGAVNTLTAHPDKKGRFKLMGKASEPALVAITVADSAGVLSQLPLATLIARNGDRLRVQTTLANPATVTVDGPEYAEAFTRFRADNAKAYRAADHSAINTAIARYVTQNPASVAAAALLAADFSIEGYEHLADSLLNILAPEARPLNIIDNISAELSFRIPDAKRNLLRTLSLHGSRDSLYHFYPSHQSLSLIAFTDASSGRRDSVEHLLKDMSRAYNPKRLRVVDISLIPDSARWRRHILGADTLGFDRTWMPGGAASTHLLRLNVVRTPYFIVADSIGHQLLRTPSAAAARSFISRRIPRPATR